MTATSPQSSIFLLVVVFIFTLVYVGTLAEVGDSAKASAADRMEAYEPLSDDTLPEYESPDRCKENNASDCQNIKIEQRDGKTNVKSNKGNKDEIPSD